ncbi:MAG: glutamine--fructose-6-phosphate transaminase (isomerizing) [Betaproteobacteria bacterium]|nr:glutamine--fructose-6-phosphate transaminase (isomerizing) [Betaproteobacteria bacterium]
MCGIVAAVHSHNIVGFLIEGLRQLEYRGYDSAGLAVLDAAQGIRRLRAVGRVQELAQSAAGMAAEVGIAHTRWATHGAVTQDNAHPHLSEGQGLSVCLVHNGIIENHEALRQTLMAQGYTFTSQTDTEVVAHLLHQVRRQSQSITEALCRVRQQLHGAYAIAAISSQDPQTVVATRLGAPLILGIGSSPDEAYLASDASALLQVTRDMVYLEDGDLITLHRTDKLGPVARRLIDADDRPIERPVTRSSLSADDVALGPYAHFMHKEIHEQPGAVAATLEMVTGAGSISAELFGSLAPAVFAQTRQVLILACGTSFHAGLVARYWLEAIAGLPCTVEIASEYRYRTSVWQPQTLVVAISQSGETADTLAALDHAKRLGAEHTLSICNVPESSLIRAAGLRFLTRAGPEIGVASTKAFTTQLAALFLLALTLAKTHHRLSAAQEAQHVMQLRHLPAALTAMLAAEPAFQTWARQFVDKDHALFLGRGIHYPIALEGALKLKEISYIHAEAYAAGELKHGPLALVDAKMPVVAVAPNDKLLEKLKSNLEEVRARGAALYVIADQGAGLTASEGVQVISLGDHAGLLSPILHVVPLQLLAYHVALARGHDVDKPRNLAKSVTVE